MEDFVDIRFMNLVFSNMYGHNGEMNFTILEEDLVDIYNHALRFSQTCNMKVMRKIF